MNIWLFCFIHFQSKIIESKKRINIFPLHDSTEKFNVGVRSCQVSKRNMFLNIFCVSTLNNDSYNIKKCQGTFYINLNVFKTIECSFKIIREKPPSQNP